MTAGADGRRVLPATGRELLARAREVADRALVSGALQPIPTHVELLHADGIDYGLRVIEGLRRKAPPAGARPANPFLPYEQALYVAHLPPRHVLLLNKFNVIEPHLLAVTEAFESQSGALDAGDFAAAQALLDRLGGLVFYNGGRIAGASQPHKHLQWVPDALWPGAQSLPVDAVIVRALARGEAKADRLPFANAIALNESPMDPVRLQRTGLELLRRVGVIVTAAGKCENYNLLLTRRWMMAVPRTREDWNGISINALGFAGALLVRSDDEAARVRAAGPATLLASVS